MGSAVDGDHEDVVAILEQAMGGAKGGGSS